MVIFGATGNVGTSLVPALAEDPEVTSVLGLARRAPALEVPKTTWARVDVTRDDLVDHLRGAQAVVHLAWAIQPSHREDILWRTNVEGSRRVFRATAEAGVGTLVYASSVGAYSPGPKEPMDESWPVEGVRSAFYARHKAQVERMLDSFEQEHPHIRVVRLRPALTFKREAATGIRRLFAGPLLPNPLVRPVLILMIPVTRRLLFQAVHSFDVADAYRRALKQEVSGAFNIAAEPVLSPQELGRLLEARPVTVPAGLLRGAAALTWRLHLQPTPEGWVEMAFRTPLMDSSRARRLLDWTPRYSSKEALSALIGGLREGADFPTPPLAAGTSGPLRWRELVTGVGRRDT